MSARHAARTGLHWTAVTLTALALTQLSPFTGVYATATDAITALGVGLIGLAATPHRKDTA
ncbi:hypothetical protein [Streptomyces adelaidensis]|uniref:hypothetical protein n=1 Tax=Streptomyces adelaidensis TaxID=2796465 RepID=UPI0019040451|nr:hypothetical protein [Streptomyces adelaidensis]